MGAQRELDGVRARRSTPTINGERNTKRESAMGRRGGGDAPQQESRMRRRRWAEGRHRPDHKSFLI